MEAGIVETVRELYKQMKSQYKEYVALHPVTNPGSQEEITRAELNRYIRSARVFIHQAQKSKDNKKDTIYVDSALSCLEQAEKLMYQKTNRHS